MLAAPPDAMRALLAHIDEEYGSMEACLETLGVDAARRARLQKACLT